MAQVLNNKGPENVLPKVFRTDPVIKPEDLCDLVRQQWKFYQAEIIPQEMYLEKTKTETSARVQDSYWQHVYQEFGLGLHGADSPEYTTRRIDLYWADVGQMRDDQGRIKFSQLFGLVKCVLTLSHGNVAPESGFSTNKSVLAVHGQSLDENTLVALWIVKDHLVNADGVGNIPITSALLKSVKNPHQKYQADLEAKRKAKEAEQKRLEEREKESAELKRKAEENEDVAEIETQTMLKKSAITVAEEAITDGNQKLQSALRQRVMSRTDLQNAQSLIDMGLEREQSLEVDISKLEQKKTLLSKSKRNDIVHVQ